MADTSPPRYVVWRERLKGVATIEPNADNIAGYWRRFWKGKGWEAVAVWYEDDGSARMSGTIGKRIEEDKAVIEETLGTGGAFAYPIPHNLYQQIVDGGDWPELYTTFIYDAFKTKKAADAASVKVWTPQLILDARAKREQEKATNGDAAVEAVKPVEVVEAQPAPTLSNSETVPPHVMLLGSIQELEAKWKAWLKEIGGKITTDDHERTAGGYARDFQQFKIKADKARAAEKEPVLQKGREIDASWKPVTSAAETMEKAVKKAAEEHVLAKRRAAEEERRAAEKAAMEARAAAPVGAVVVAPPTVELSTSGSFRVREREVVVVVDEAELLAAYMKSDAAKNDARAWAERQFSITKQPVPGTKIEIKEGVR